MLGESLSGQKKYDEALPLLLSGFNEMKERESTIPASGKIRLYEAALRLANFYDATGKPDQAKEWKNTAASLAVPKAGGP
jgi:hypothetical protein